MRKEAPLPTAHPDLRSFLKLLEEKGELVRITAPVSPRLEITEICRRLLAVQGPALLFSNVEGSSMPMVANLFGTERRVALAMGRPLQALEALGERLARLRSPEPPKGGLKGLLATAREMAIVRHMPPRLVKNPPCQEVILEGEQVDLSLLPVMTCWPEDAAPLITWGMVITQPPGGGPVNLGIYRMQVIGRNRLIMRWLKHRGGAQHARLHDTTPMPVAVAIGADPATILAAVTPLPENLSEYAFAGLLREQRAEVALATSLPLPVPAGAEIVLEGYVDLRDQAEEGPFGDHTGYYNEVETFPVFTVKRITMRRDALYLSTFTGRPPDEPAVLALALNRVFVPMLRRQFPEITAFHLPAEACSYRVAVVAMEKQYPGHAFRVMTGIWGFLRQFLYVKYIIVVDAGVDVRNWEAISEVICCNVHGARDLHILRHTPIDYLDFASPHSGLGSKLGLDATHKIGPEREAVPPSPEPPASHACDWPAALLRTVRLILEVRIFPGGCMTVVRIRKQDPGQGRKAAEAVWRMVPPGCGADSVWVVDEEIHASDWNDLMWVLATRTDPGRDVMIEEETGRFAIDATTKLPGEVTRPWGRPLEMDPAMVAQVTRRWSEYGLPSLPEGV